MKPCTKIESHMEQQNSASFHTDLLPILSTMQKKTRCSTQIILLEDCSEQDIHRNQTKLQKTNKELPIKITIKKQEEIVHQNQTLSQPTTKHQSIKPELEKKPKIPRRKAFKMSKYIDPTAGQQKWTRLRKKTNPWYNSQVQECSKLESFLISHNHSKVSNRHIYRQLRRLRNTKSTAN